MMYPFRDVKQLKLSDKSLSDVWREMTEDKQKVILIIIKAITTKRKLADEQKLKCLELIPSFSDDEYALLCFYAGCSSKPLFIYEGD